MWRIVRVTVTLQWGNTKKRKNGREKRRSLKRRTSRGHASCGIIRPTYIRRPTYRFRTNTPPTRPYSRAHTVTSQPKCESGGVPSPVCVARREQRASLAKRARAQKDEFFSWQCATLLRFENRRDQTANVVAPRQYQRTRETENASYTFEPPLERSLAGHTLKDRCSLFSTFFFTFILLDVYERFFYATRSIVFPVAEVRQRMIAVR